MSENQRKFVPFSKKYSITEVKKTDVCQLKPAFDTRTLVAFAKHLKINTISLTSL